LNHASFPSAAPLKSTSALQPPPTPSAPLLSPSLTTSLAPLPHPLLLPFSASHPSLSSPSSTLPPPASLAPSSPPTSTLSQRSYYSSLLDEHRLNQLFDAFSREGRNGGRRRLAGEAVKEESSTVVSLSPLLRLTHSSCFLFSRSLWLSYVRICRASSISTFRPQQQPYCLSLFLLSCFARVLTTASHQLKPSSASSSTGASRRPSIRPSPFSAPPIRSTRLPLLLIIFET
jgi:hypothetical protein